jgi:hypothetical protein
MLNEIMISISMHLHVEMGSRQHTVSNEMTKYKDNDNLFMAHPNPQRGKKGKIGV